MIRQIITTYGAYRMLKENPTELYRRIGWGDFILRKALFRQFGTISDPEQIKQVLVTNANNYRKTPITRSLLEPLLGHGLLTSEGDFWRRQRRIEAPAFHHKRIRDFTALMVEETLVLLAEWSKAAEAGRSIHLQDDMSRVTMSIISRAMFSNSLSAEEMAQVSGAIRSFRNNRIKLRDLFGLPEWVPRRRPKEFLDALATVDRIINGLIEERQADGVDRGDLLSMLLLARDAETGETMDDRQVRDEVMTIFIAGHETTATALTWVFYVLDGHRDVERRLQEEVDRVLGGRAATLDDVANLPYARMVLEETMRIHPPVPQIARQAIGEDSIGGVRVPAGAFVNINIWLTHRNPAIWVDPDRFDPERFSPENTANRHKLAYFPFGGGPRICVGNSFALLEGQLLLATIAQTFQLRRAENSTVIPIGSVVLRPDNGLPMRLERRTDTPAQARPAAAE